MDITRSTTWYLPVKSHRRVQAFRTCSMLGKSCSAGSRVGGAYKALKSRNLSTSMTTHTWRKQGARSRFMLHASKREELRVQVEDVESDSEREQWLVRYAWALVALPLLSLPFIPLANFVQELKVDSNQGLGTAAILGLLLGKRVYLYALALTGLDLAAWRSVNAPLGLGSRFKVINDELLDGLQPPKTEAQ
eukprot:9148910-Pyramimonas_sp.AAC.2